MKVLNDKYSIGIDAVNISGGGGLTHLREIINAIDFDYYPELKFVIWGRKSVLKVLRSHPNIEKNIVTKPYTGIFSRLCWQVYGLSLELKKAKSDVLFAPGGTHISMFKPAVVLSQNLLPFQISEALRFGFSLQIFKTITLTFVQSISFRRSEGMIFLSLFAQKTVQKFTGNLMAKSVVIPHGIDFRFRNLKMAKELFPYKKVDLLYVSTIDHYKHQSKIIKYTWFLRNKTGWNLKLKFIGSARPSALKEFETAIAFYDPDRLWIEYLGVINFDHMSDYYKETDIAIFASTCENLPNILIEKMASGIPIISTSVGPMPEVLKDAGLYFDIDNYESFSLAITRMVLDARLRGVCSERAKILSHEYNWKICADQTLQFLIGIASKHKGKRN